MTTEDGAVHAGTWLGVGALFAGAGVALGAFGAHALRSSLDPGMLEVYETGVRYHLIHALGIIGSALALGAKPSSWREFQRAAWCFGTGVVLFSGSLYLLALTGIAQFGFVTPFGGICFIFGWGFLACGGFRRHLPQD
jgi:uncharacterized membrane protein YgdD (TMEM256/DUF423 family)